MNDLVSIIISSYNAENYILETVNSILNQSHKNIELIVIDDGSTDRTVNILKKSVNNENFILIEKEHSGNIGRNLNSGIKLSRGAYVCVCGADDVWESNKLEIQYNFLLQYECISSNASLINSANMVISNVYYDNFKINKLVTLKDLVYNNVIIASTVIIRKSILNECGFFDEMVGNRPEDYYLWLNIAEKYPIYFLSDCLVKYRKHKNNLSSKSLSDYEELSLRSIAIRKKYLEYSEDIQKAAKEGILLEYSRLLKTCIEYKDFNRYSFHCKSARNFINNKISLKYLKFLFSPFLKKFVHTLHRK